MKKISLKYSWFGLMVGLLFACSYEDKSIYVEELLPKIFIDTTGVSDGSIELRVNRDSVLSIHPKIVFEEATDEDFEYEWRLGLQMEGGAAAGMGDYIVLSTQKNLDWTVDIFGTPQYKFFPLWYRVKHKKTGMIATIKWLLTVLSEVPSGMVVIDTEDEQTSDFTVVRHRCFMNTMAAGKPASYNRNIYSRTHGGQKFDGVVKNIFHQKLYKGAELVNYMHGFTDNNRIFRMDTYNFDVVAEGKDLFYDADIELNIDNYVELGTWNSVSAFCIIDGKLYNRLNERNGDIVISKFGLPLTMDEGCRIPSQLAGAERLVFLSEEDGRFYRVNISDYVDYNAPQPYADSVAIGAAFDPNNLKGYKTVAAETFGVHDFRFVLEKEGKYYFCTLNRDRPGEWYDLSNAPDIEHAVAFAIGKQTNYIWYATPDKVYTINRNIAGKLSYNEFYDPEDPIEKLWLHKGSLDASMQMDTRECGLLVTTWNGTEGKLHWTTTGSGTSATGYILYDWENLPGVAVFDGFKRIVAVANIW